MLLGIERPSHLANKTGLTFHTAKRWMQEVRKRWAGTLQCACPAFPYLLHPALRRMEGESGLVCQMAWSLDAQKHQTLDCLEPFWREDWNERGALETVAEGFFGNYLVYGGGAKLVGFLFRTSLTMF